jgi:plastocyanin
MVVLSRAKSWAVLMLIFGVAAWIGYGFGEEPSALSALTTVEERVREVKIVTGEFKSGKMEAYRWDPGTVVMHQGDHVILKMFGVNGTKHPFVIQGLGVEGEVVKGKETVVKFQASVPGIYEIVCTSHPEMVGYLVVLDD